MLINFLREILYLFNGEKFVTGSCEIIKFTNKELQVRLTGESFNSKKHLIKTEIKAVTYSGAKVEKLKMVGGQESFLTCDSNFEKCHAERARLEANQSKLSPFVRK